MTEFGNWKLPNNLPPSPTSFGPLIASGKQRGVRGEKYVNIPSEKYIYVHIYVCICVYTYLCKMDERWSYASLSKKWMSTGLMLACQKNG